MIEMLKVRKVLEMEKMILAQMEKMTRKKRTVEMHF